MQIESAEAVRNAEAILSVPGVDGCWIGPADMAKPMGIDRNAPGDAKAHLDAILSVRDACRKTGKICGISGGYDISYWLHSAMLCGFLRAKAFTALGARRSELPSRSTGFTAEPMHLA